MIREHSIISDAIAPHLKSFVELLGFPQLATLASERWQTIIAVLGATWGAFTTYRFHQSRLHRRLEEYISDHKTALHAGVHDTLGALNQPTSDGTLNRPIFSRSLLLQVLRTRNWVPLLSLAGTEFVRTDRKLNRASISIKEKLNLARQRVLLLEQQETSAFIVKGAIASARGAARVTETERTHWNNIALENFGVAKSLSNPKYELLARFLYAEQLYRNADDTNAEAELKSFLAMANPTSENFTKYMIVAKLHLALLLQVSSFPTGNQRAFALLSDPTTAGGNQDIGTTTTRFTDPWLSGPSALDLCEKLEPNFRWDLALEGDVNYALAFVARANKSTKIERRKFKRAFQCYQRVLRETDGFWDRRKMRALRADVTSKLEHMMAAFDDMLDLSGTITTDSYRGLRLRSPKFEALFRQSDQNT
ncbi:MAG: hypothetical protein AAGJ70_00580 [Pseudomonadota bacterium]